MYNATLLIRNDVDGKKYLYDIVNIKENTAAAFDLEKQARQGGNKSATQGGVSNTNNTQNQTVVNTPAFKNPMTAALYKADMVDENGNPKSLKLTDSDGNELTEAQQEYYKDSKVRDENGNLKVMYLGKREEGKVNSEEVKGAPHRGAFF